MLKLEMLTQMHSKRKKVEKIMGLAKGVNPSGQTGEKAKVAKDAAK